jgi:glycosyltransferase involved in cell wall biosynthesis
MGAWLERVQTVGTEGYEARRLAFLAHLVRRQGADILLDALAVLGSQAGIAADVIGSGPLEDDLRARARALGLEDVVTFHGFLDDHREVERLLASASLGMAPYRPGEMSFTAYADPGKLKAYLAAGLPILMTDVPPNARELARDGGAEIVPFEATAIAETVLRVLESPETWKKRSEAARSYARRFDWPLLFDELMASLSLEVVPGR